MAYSVRMHLKELTFRKEAHKTHLKPKRNHLKSFEIIRNRMSLQSKNQPNHTQWNEPIKSESACLQCHTLAALYSTGFCVCVWKFSVCAEEKSYYAALSGREPKMLSNLKFSEIFNVTTKTVGCLHNSAWKAAGSEWHAACIFIFANFANIRSRMPCNA